MKRISLVFLILTIGWMMTIFYFSSQDGDESTEDSLSVGYRIGYILHSDFKEWSEEEQYNFAQKIDHPIRKTAHATEYAILGILTYCIYKDKTNKWMWIAWMICILYASSDEFHQLFVSGRSGQVSDVLLDSVGALAGIGILKLKEKISLKFHK